MTKVRYIVVDRRRSPLTGCLTLITMFVLWAGCTLWWKNIQYELNKPSTSTKINYEPEYNPQKAVEDLRKKKDEKFWESYRRAIDRE